MKASQLAILTVAWSVLSALGQGTITFGNQIPGVLEAPIYGSEWDWVHYGGDYADAKTGNTAAGLPAGTQTYKGSPVAGWNVEFFATWPGADPAHAAMLYGGETTTRTGTGSNAGFFPTTTVAFPFPFPTYSGLVTVQVRVWYPVNGDRNWYEAWMDRDPAAAAASALFTAQLGGTATDFRSFSAGWLDPVTWAPPVPEPSVLGLSALAVLGFRHRHKRSR